MAKLCEFCEKRTLTGRMIARRGLAKKKGGVGKKITGIHKRKYRPNIQRIRVYIDGTVKRVKICTKCLKAGKVAKPPSRKASNPQKPQKTEA